MILFDGKYEIVPCEMFVTLHIRRPKKDGTGFTTVTKYPGNFGQALRAIANHEMSLCDTVEEAMTLLREMYEHVTGKPQAEWIDSPMTYRKDKPKEEEPDDDLDDLLGDDGEDDFDDIL